MEERGFRSISIREGLCKQIEEYLTANPNFINENPESKSIAGFVDKATRTRLKELKKEIAQEA